MKPRSRTAQWHLLLWEAAAGAVRWNSFHCFACTVWLCTKAGRRWQWESRNNTGGRNLGHHSWVWTAALGRDLRVGKCHRYSPSPDCGVLEAFGLHRKFYLHQVNIIQRTPSQAVRKTTALKNQELCHSMTTYAQIDFGYNPRNPYNQRAQLFVVATRTQLGSKTCSCSSQASKEKPMALEILLREEKFGTKYDKKNCKREKRSKWRCELYAWQNRLGLE